MAKAQPDPVVHELEKIVKLLAIGAVRDLPKGEAVQLLAAAGFTAAETASVIGTTDGSVRAMLSQAKRPPKAGRGTRPPEEGSAVK